MPHLGSARSPTDSGLGIFFLGYSRGLGVEIGGAAGDWKGWILRPCRPAKRPGELVAHASSPHAGVGEALEPSPARGVQRREPIGLARAPDGVGDASAGGLALGGGAPFRYASALALSQEGRTDQDGERINEREKDQLMDEVNRQGVATSEA